MKNLINLFVVVILLTGFTFTQERPDKRKDMIITPDGKLMSRIDGSIIEPNYDLNTLKNKKSENDAPIGTPFSWDGGLGFYSSGSNTVYAIAVSGSDVYIGGDFTDAMGNPGSNYILRYNQKNNTWHSLLSGLNGPVHVIAVSGNDVYVGGEFTDAGGNLDADRIARWDGSSWNALGVGLNDVVYAIAISGSDIYVGGNFLSAGGIFGADYIARWDGSSWNFMGQLDGSVSAIVVNGSYVYVGGYFSYVNSATAVFYFATYDGFSWGSLGTPLDSDVKAIAISGSDLYIGGAFKNAGGNANADAVAYFDLSIPSSDWKALGNGIINNDALPNGIVEAIAVNGDDVYVGGPFYNGWNSNFNNIAYWNGTVWNDLSSSLSGGCFALALSGTDVLVGGYFGFNRWFGVYAEGLYAGVQNSAVSGSGIIEFNTTADSTRITLNLIETGKGNGIFNVFCYENKPADGEILPVSNHRWIIQNTGFFPTINFSDIIRIKFSDFIDSSGIINPYTVKIYHRVTPGRGQFTELYTEYDDNTNELWAYINSYGEFAIGIPSTVDGIIDQDEYVNHVEGQNMQTSDGKTWYMRTDDYYMYFGISNYSDSSDAVSIYLDNSASTPVNYHFNPFGTETGSGKDGLSTNLPFGAEFFAYVKPTYDEYRHTDQIGGWMDSVENDFIKSYNDPANIFEFAIPLSSLPVSYYTSNYPLLWFNWLGFLSNSGIISSRVPNNANPSGIPDDLSWYYPSSVNNFSFARSSYTHIGLSFPNFGAFNCYNFTFFPTSPTASITRTSGEWNIDGELVVYEGTLTFANPDSVKLLSLLHMDGNINFPGDVPLEVRGNIYQTNTYGANLNFSSGHSTVIDLAFGSGSIYTSAPFQNLTTRFGNIDLISDIIINESLTLQNGNIKTINFDTSYVRMNQGAVVTRSGSGYVDGYLVRWASSGIVDFPVGTANGYSPVSFNFNNVTNLNTITVGAFQNVHPNVVTQAQSMQRYWNITKNSALTFTNTSINFQYLPQDFNSAFFEATDEAAMVVGKYDNSWSFPTISSRLPGGPSDGGSITVSGITSFSDFTLGRNEAALPVELTSFTASKKNNSVQLKWSTATEINNYGFEIEKTVHTSTPLSVTRWEKIGFVEGGGNSNSIIEYSFTDTKLFGGSKFIYRLKQIDNEGTFSYSDEINVEVVPNKFELSQNYPNPFNPGTKIRYSIPNIGSGFAQTVLKVYDVLGNEVATLVNEEKPAGVYEVVFDPINLSSGIYIYKLQVAEFILAKKMTLIK